MDHRSEDHPAVSARERKLVGIPSVGRLADERIRSIVEAVSIPIALTDASGNIVHINRAFTQLTGYTIEDVADLANWRTMAYPDPQYRQWVIDSWEKIREEARQGGKPLTPLEATIVCKDGMKRAFLITPPLTRILAGSISSHFTTSPSATT